MGSNSLEGRLWGLEASTIRDMRLLNDLNRIDVIFILFSILVIFFK